MESLFPGTGSIVPSQIPFRFCDVFVFVVDECVLVWLLSDEFSEAIQRLVLEMLYDDRPAYIGWPVLCHLFAVCELRTDVLLHAPFLPGLQELLIGHGLALGLLVGELPLWGAR